MRQLSRHLLHRETGQSRREGSHAARREHPGLRSGTCPHAGDYIRDPVRINMSDLQSWRHLWCHTHPQPGQGIPQGPSWRRRDDLSTGLSGSWNSAVPSRKRTAGPRLCISAFPGRQLASGGKKWGNKMHGSTGRERQSSWLTSWLLKANQLLRSREV